MARSSISHHRVRMVRTRNRISRYGHSLWKCLGCLGYTLGLLLTLAPTAGAQAYQVGWWLKANGSAQVVAEANHLWAEGYSSGAGYYQGRFFDNWLDTYCQINGIWPGDGQGTPLRIQLAAPYGWAQGCIPVQQSQYQGWTDGLGTYSGQNFWHSGYVAIYESYVFPRSGNNSRGTTLELY